MLKQVAPLRLADGSVPRAAPEAAPANGGFHMLSLLPGEQIAMVHSRAAPRSPSRPRWLCACLTVVHPPTP